MSSEDAVVATWTESTGCGTRFERLTADGRLHVSFRPPFGEPWFEGDDDPDYNPVCNCPSTPQAWCAECGGCADCWECSHRPGRA